MMLVIFQVQVFTQHDMRNDYDYITLSPSSGVSLTTTGMSISPSYAIDTLSTYSVPGMPTMAGVCAGVDWVSFRWTDPSSNGGSSIVGYVWSLSSTGLTIGSPYRQANRTTFQAYTWTDLQTTTTYTLSVYAVNAAGLGPAATVK